MKINALRCNHCSANLEIKPKIKFFTCSYCGSSLTIKSSGNVLYTEIIDEIKDNTDTLIDQNDQILKEQAIERLDRDWEMKREKYKVTGSNGEVYYPEGNSNILLGIISLVVVIVVFGIAINQIGQFPYGDSSFIRSIAVLIFIVSIIGIISKMVFFLYKKGNYDRAKSKYLSHRQTLLNGQRR